MKPQEIIDKLVALGFLLDVKDDKLILKKGDKASLTPELTEAIKANKAGIIQLLIEEIDSPYFAASYLKQGWSQEMADMLAWLWTAPNPEVSFVNIGGKLVVDQKAFWREIGDEINLGPNSAKAKSGELKKIIQQLQRME